MPQTLLLGVGLHELDLLGRTTGQLEIAERGAVDRKIATVEPNSGDMLPIVARSAIGRAPTPAP